MQLVHEKDNKGNSALDVASFLGYNNLALYLIKNGADPSSPDLRKRNAFHYLAQRGQYDVTMTFLNFVRHQRREDIFASLNQLKKTYGFKALDIKHGALVSTVWHDN